MNNDRSYFSRLEALKGVKDLVEDRRSACFYAAVENQWHDKGKIRHSRIWRIRPDGGAQPVTPDAISAVQPRPHPGPHPGRDVLAFAACGETGQFRLYCLAGEACEIIGAIPGTVEKLAWAPDGERLLVLAADEGVDAGGVDGAQRLSWSEHDDPQVTDTARRRRLYAVDYPGGATREIGAEDMAIWEFSPFADGASLAVIASQDPSERGWHHAKLYRLDLETGRFHLLYEPEWQMQCPRPAPSGRHVAVIEGWASDRGMLAGQIRLISTGDGAASDLLADEHTNVTWLDWIDDERLRHIGWSRVGTAHGVVTTAGRMESLRHEECVLGSSFWPSLSDGPGLAAIREAPGLPPEVALFEADSGKWAPITAFNEKLTATLPDYPQIRTVEWRTPDGLELQGLVMLPADWKGGALPTVVSVHGGPTWTANLSFDPGGASAIAAAGYCVFLPNYRGNAGWGQKVARMNIGDPCGAEYADILAGVDACIAQGYADGDRLGITGVSYGGYLTAWAAATDTRFKAAVMVSGISDHLSCHFSCNHAFSEFILGGSPGKPRFQELGNSRSPLSNIGKVPTPTLILHGKEDRCTPLGQAQAFYYGLLENGGTACLVAYPDEGHGFQERRHRADATQRLLAWFDEYLRSAA